MNAQRTRWSLRRTLPPQGVPYAGGYIDIGSRSVHLWFCDHEMKRVAYKVARIPDAVIDNLTYYVSGNKRYAFPTGPSSTNYATGCTQDGLFLFVNFVNTQLGSNSFLDRLYYVVVDKDASEWRSGSVSLSHLRLPDGNNSYDLTPSDYGKWLWDGRFITCMMYSVGKTVTTDVGPGESPCASRTPIRVVTTTDETYKLPVVRIDTADNSVTTLSPSVADGSAHEESVRVYSDQGPTHYQSWSRTEDIPVGFLGFAYFASPTTAVYGRNYRSASTVYNHCESIYTCSNTQRNTLVHAEGVVLVDEGSRSEFGSVDCSFSTSTFWVKCAVVEHDARPAAYIAHRHPIGTDRPMERIICLGTRVLVRVPIEGETIGWLNVLVTRLTAIGASDDVVWYDDKWAVVGATNETMSVFIDGPSRRIAPWGRPWGPLTTWWLLTISLENGRVIREVKLEPVYTYPPWGVEVGGDIRAMPMVSVLGGKPFKI
jgi:hypothetical protein